MRTARSGIILVSRISMRFSFFSSMTAMRSEKADLGVHLMEVSRSLGKTRMSREIVLKRVVLLFGKFVVP